MKIAVIGAGFAGLAAAHALLKNHTVSLFDAEAPGAAASGIAAGLLHPYMGLRANLNREGPEGLHAAKTLLREASHYTEQPVYQESGMLRVAITSEQKKFYASSAETYEDVEWWEAERCQEAVAGLSPNPGIFISSACTVFTKTYLEGLFKCCLSKGMVYEQKSIESLQELHSFDRIIVACGASTERFPDIPPLNLTLIKGQVLKLKWSRQLPFPVNSHAYLIPGKGAILAGATFEKEFHSPVPDKERAVELMQDKIRALIPGLETASLLDCKAGIRAAAPGHMPIVKQVSEKVWVFTGLGSKGLLYHALYAQKLAQAV